MNLRQYSSALLLALVFALAVGSGELFGKQPESVSPAQLTGLFGRRGMTQAETALLQMVLSTMQRQAQQNTTPTAGVSNTPVVQHDNSMLLMLLMMMMQGQQQPAPPLAAPAAPAAHQPLTVYLVQPQQLPISGSPLQNLPIQGQPLQNLPIQGIPLQQLPIAGPPLQRLPIQGSPLQQLPLAPTMPPAAMSVPWGCPDGKCPAQDYSRQTARTPVSTASRVRLR